jgi:hypothetical protein
LIIQVSATAPAAPSFPALPPSGPGDRRFSQLNIDM